MSVAEILEDGFVLPLARHGIAVQPRDASRRKRAVEFLLHLLGPHAQEIDMVARALGANARHLFRVAAVVAQQAPVALVIGQRQGAIHALHALAARATGDETRKE